MKDKEYDLVAIGGGTAGLVSAAGAAYLGLRSAIIERDALGGDCLWTGCVPSKALIASARLAHGMRNADELGLAAADPQHAFASVVERMRAARGVVEHHDDPERFRAMGVDVQFGAARFLSATAIDVDGVGTIRSRRFVIATGATPTAPPIVGLAEAGYLNHHTVFEAQELPKRIVVLGAGPIGLEMAQVFARLGATTTVLEMQDRILSGEDEEAAVRLLTILRGEGIDIRLEQRVERVEVVGHQKHLMLHGGGRVVTDEIFVATGRRPETGGLDLERAGVRTRGSAVEVDLRLRTSNPRIWAAGDVTGGLQFTHVAEYMAKTVLRNALVPGSVRVNYSHVPRVTYTDPELARVGLTEEEAALRGGRTYSYELADLDRAIVDGVAQGFVKISADRKGRVLGASLLGVHAGELILPLVMAMQHGLTLSDISSTIFPYPTLSEGIKRTSDAYQKSRLEGTGGRVLRKVISWMK
ncbi:MAG: FAD-dependent oxidoreductase [Gemmatimonadetes bacterium]|nr:FAD-dependent oxidoreductase [Gemmatimonadota bacterium]MDA1104213.1 FAD-dependent oxidoreductase [Gemmatimonadota bacterium]